MLTCTFISLMTDLTPITVETLVNATVGNTWHAWVTPEHIVKWNAASDDWHTPRASMDLKIGGELIARMEAKDGSVGFDFKGTFTKVVPKEILEYVMEDGRTVSVQFRDEGGMTRVIETFDPETENTPELQRAGWQAILDSFKRYTESLAQ